MFINLQANSLPKQWRQISFDKILELASNFSAVPLSEANEGSKPLFRGKSMKITEERQYVNWKRILTAIALNANPYPKTKDLQAYIIKLESLVDPETGLISEAQFIEVSSLISPDSFQRFLRSLILLKAQYCLDKNHPSARTASRTRLRTMRKR